MMRHIDLSMVLRQTVACDLYSNLVTRPTGAAVRGEIERLLGESGERTLTIIDFSRVSMIDFSCADEVIAKLLLRYCRDDAPPPCDAYFLFRGVTDDHWDAIEAVLERHGLALAIEREGTISVAGVIGTDERHVWETVYRLSPVTLGDLAGSLTIDLATLRAALASLRRRRLVMEVAETYVAVGRGRG